ncbi:hypothetical protein I6A84_40335 [Frankia sp. CNm7]|uniref:Carboxypeptidase regulatory-like domain-containing protein n=1 Tax=Frankia nepalensis TaxID=1836974 RepID=A0A937RFN7_9ACTN|nr:hypothetical protein [Frankia nepalensis]MBL7501114.1 hypothetical protein [Frankia nepalensis]MBL7512736.1 hypothetical protein [Frankia nepalensis]MBL7524126.1 hypothetical protein [Frankia nepalensis]MBL7631308.1 hypothetical protein [Frankia nepalensis]
MRRIGGAGFATAAVAIATVFLPTLPAQAEEDYSVVVHGLATCPTREGRSWTPTAVRFHTYAGDWLQTPTNSYGDYSLTVPKVGDAGLTVGATVFCPAEAGGPWNLMERVLGGQRERRLDLLYVETA